MSSRTKPLGKLPPGARAVYRVNFSNPGGDDGYVVGYWSELADAEAGAEHRGDWGSPGNVHETVVVEIAGKTYELAQCAPIVVDRSEPAAEKLAKARKTALAKLDPAERKLLGLES